MNCRSALPSVLVILMMLLSSAGCGSDDGGPPLHSVTGQVTFSGTPIATGEIRFIDKDGKRSDGGPIENGGYSLETTVGAKRIEIYATREDPANMVESAVEPGKMMPATEMYIPEKFNSSSELSEEVTESGPNAFNFAIE